MGTNVLTTPNPIKPPSTSDPIPQVVAVSAEGWCPYVRRDVAGRLACRGTPSRGHTPQSALPVAGGWFGCFRILGGAEAPLSPDWLSGESGGRGFSRGLAVASRARRRQRRRRASELLGKAQFRNALIDFINEHHAIFDEHPRQAEKP